LPHILLVARQFGLEESVLKSCSVDDQDNRYETREQRPPRTQQERRAQRLEKRACRAIRCRCKFSSPGSASPRRACGRGSGSPGRARPGQRDLPPAALRLGHLAGAGRERRDLALRGRPARQPNTDGSPPVADLCAGRDVSSSRRRPWVWGRPMMGWTWPAASPSSAQHGPAQGAFHRLASCTRGSRAEWRSCLPA
jgi:hypothetical protein